MVQDARETELKFALTNEALEQLRWEVFGTAQARRLVSVYYDTPDRRLCGRGLALRLRSEGEGWTQTLKAQGAVSRFEDEAVVEGRALRPERLTGPPAGLDPSTLDALAPMFEVCVERRTLDIDHAGACIELALDEGVVRAGSSEAPIRELELELKSGRLADLFEAARGLCLRPGVQLSLASKAEQGFRLADGAAATPAHFRRPWLADDVAAGEAFQALTLAALAQLSSAALLAGATDDPEAVHQARVGLRRLRVLIGAFEPLVSDARMGTIKGELRRMTEIFADARSLDVFGAGEPADPGDRAGRDLHHTLQRARAEAHRKVRAAVTAASFGAGLIDVCEWLLCGPWTDDPARAAARDRPLAGFASGLIERRRRRLAKRGRRLDWSDVAARHKLRIQAKKLHYLIDALAPSQTQTRAYRRLKRLQARLGELNDIATAEAAARLALGDGAAPAVALALGLLVGQRLARAPRLTRRTERAFRKWAKAPPIRAAEA